MCDSHIEATGNLPWLAHSRQVFGELLSAAKVTDWSACPQGNVSGVCGLLLGDRYADPLWRDVGHQREEKIYDSILTGNSLEMPVPKMISLPNCSYPYDTYSNRTSGKLD